MICLLASLLFVFCCTFVNGKDVCFGEKCTVEWVDAQQALSTSFVLPLGENPQRLFVKSLLRVNIKNVGTSTVTLSMCVTPNATAVDWTACAWSNVGAVLNAVGADVSQQSIVIIDWPGSSVGTAAVGLKLAPHASERELTDEDRVSIVARPIQSVDAFNGDLSLSIGDARVFSVAHFADRQSLNVQQCTGVFGEFVETTLSVLATSVPLADAFTVSTGRTILGGGESPLNRYCVAPCTALVNAPKAKSHVDVVLSLTVRVTTSNYDAPTDLTLTRSAEGQGKQSPFPYGSTLTVVRLANDLLVSIPTVDAADVSLFTSCSGKHPVFNSMGVWSSACWLRRNVKPHVSSGDLDVTDGSFYTFTDFFAAGTCTSEFGSAAVALVSDNVALSTQFKIDDIALLAEHNSNPCTTPTGVEWSSISFWAGITLGSLVVFIVLGLIIVSLWKQRRKADYAAI